MTTAIDKLRNTLTKSVVIFCKHESVVTKREVTTTNLEYPCGIEEYHIHTIKLDVCTKCGLKTEYIDNPISGDICKLLKQYY